MQPPDVPPTSKRFTLADALKMASWLLALAAICATFVMTARMIRLEKEFAAYQRHADERIVKANAAAEAAKTETARMTVRLGEVERQAALLLGAARPRSISKTQQTAIIPLLRRFAGQTVNVHALDVSYETSDFAEQVAATLRAAGIESETGIELGMPGQGLAVRVRDSASVPALAAAIRSAFRFAGIPMDLVADPSVSAGTCEVVVGAKAAS